MYRTRSERRAARRLHDRRDRELIENKFWIVGLKIDYDRDIVKHPGRGSRSRFLKKQCSRFLRRRLKTDYECGDGNLYRRASEFRRELYW